MNPGVFTNSFVSYRELDRHFLIPGHHQEQSLDIVGTDERIHQRCYSEIIELAQRQ